MYDEYGKIIKDKTKAHHSHVKKSGWRKIALAFNFDWNVTDPALEQAEDKDGKFFLYKCIATVLAPNGRRTQAAGACSSRNPFFSKKRQEEKIVQPEDIAMMSQTVALSRAISDMVGSGEISAEEISAANWNDTKKTSKKTEPKKKPPKETKTDTTIPPAAKSLTIEDFVNADEAAILKTLAWFNRAKMAGMSEEAYTNMKEKFAVGVTVGEMKSIEEWLMKHFPEQSEVG